MKKYLSAFLLILPLLTISCKENKQDEPTPDGGIISGMIKNIIGQWLLSSSDDSNWVTYEFTETSRLNVEMENDGSLINGSGFYFVYEDKPTISGSFTTPNNQTFYIDWIAKKSQAFQIDFEQYNKQEYLGVAAIYRIVGNIEITLGSSEVPQYRDYTGQTSNSEFISLDSDIINVDSNTGEICAKSIGSTFIIFDTKNGKAVIKVTVTKRRTLADVIVGTWIYDFPKEHEWQKTTFFTDNMMEVEWGLDNVEEIAGHGTGKYEVIENNVIFTVNSAGTIIPQEWRVESFNEYDCTYECYSDNYFAGRYTGHRLVYSYEIAISNTITPDYKSLIGNLSIKGFQSHNESVATVNSNGKITAEAEGRTYIEILTDIGAAVVEIIVK